MSTIERNPLGGFEERLLSGLKAHVASRSVPTTQPTAGSARHRTSWPPTAALVVAATAVVAILVAVLNATPGIQPALAQAFPILTHRPQQLPAYMQRILRSQRLVSGDSPLDRDRAYAFQTSSGLGYVVVDQQTKWLCILVPDLGTSGPGIRCATGSRLLSGHSHGLQLTVSHQDRREIVALLPAGSSATVITTRGTTRPIALRDGVLTILTRRPITITTLINGRRSTTGYSNR